MKRLSMLIAVTFGLLGLHSADAACTAEKFIYFGGADGSLKVIEDCLKEGTDVNITDKEGYTALRTALETYANPAVIKYLLNVPGINVNAKKGGDGTTPLMEVAQRAAGDLSAIDIIKSLLAKGADVNAVDNDGRTAFIYVSGYTHVPYATNVLARLLKAGAQVNAVDNHGKTALDDIVSEIKTLKQYKPKSRDLHIALDMRDFLLQHGALTGEQLREHKSK